MAEPAPQDDVATVLQSPPHAPSTRPAPAPPTVVEPRPAERPPDAASTMPEVSGEPGHVKMVTKATDLPQIAGYELLGVLGRGGIGIVYRARDLALDRIVALKMLRSGALADAQEIERFHREAQATAQLNHPHLVPIYGAGQHGELHYFSMARVDGGNLAHHLDRFRDPKAAVGLMEKVARAVHHAHTHHILHRDLKPSNILLNGDGEPLVSDFGLAKMLDSKLELTQPGDMVGTPLYMAPEQATGRPDQVS